MTTDNSDRLIAVIEERTRNMADDIQEIKERLKTDFVSQKEYWPVKMLVFGSTALMLTTLLGALMALVIKR